jgi:hypothetical protein
VNKKEEKGRVFLSMVFDPFPSPVSVAAPPTLTVIGMYVKNRNKNTKKKQARKQGSKQGPHHI